MLFRSLVNTLTGIVFFFLSSCTQQQSSQKTVARRTALIPAFQKEISDPRYLWLLELSAPSLLNEKSLKWECDTTQNLLKAKWTLANTTCSELSFLDPSTKQQVRCTQAKTFEMTTTSCNNFIVEQHLFKIRLAPSDAILTEKQTNVFSPSSRFAGQFSAPSTLQLSSSDTALDLSTPSLKEWFLKAQSAGALELTLSIPSSDKTSALALLHFLSTQSSPKHLEPLSSFFESALSGFRMTPSMKKEKLSLPIVTTPHNDPLLKSACRYIQDWMRSHLALSELPLSLENTAGFNCKFLWESASPEEYVFARLPLPFYSSLQNKFPFASRSDALDIRILSSIGHF